MLDKHVVCLNFFESADDAGDAFLAKIGNSVTVLVGAVGSHVPARPAARQSFSLKWGAAGWGEQYVFC
jgi:hypothetical protein